MVQLILRAGFPAWASYIYEAELNIWARTVSSNSHGGMSSIATTNAELTSYYQCPDSANREVRALGIDSGNFDEPISCSLETVSISGDSFP